MAVGKTNDPEKQRKKAGGQDMKQKRFRDLRDRNEIREYIIQHPIRLYFEARFLVELWEEAKDETECVLDSIKEVFLYIVAMAWIFMRVLFYPAYKVWTIYRIREKVKKSNAHDGRE